MSARRGDAELAAVMRKLLTASGPQVVASVDPVDGAFYIDGEVQITEEEQQAIEEVWDE